MQQWGRDLGGREEVLNTLHGLRQEHWRQQRLGQTAEPEAEPEPEPEPVVVHVPPTFAENLQPKSVILDEASSWVLPEVTIGSAALKEVVVVPVPTLTNSIDYDAQSRTVTFSASDLALEAGFK